MDKRVSPPDFEETASFITEKFIFLRVPYRQWADLARRAVQGLPYDIHRLAGLETFINATRSELRKAIVVASEHFTEEQLDHLRKQASMSKQAWKSLKKTRAITIQNGFTLISY